MGSTSLALPTDNRVAVTDQAFGMSTSVSGSRSAVGYSPFSGIAGARDLSMVESGGLQLSGSVGNGSNISFNTDQGALDKSLNWASGVLSLLVNSSKEQATAAATAQSNSIGQAVSGAIASTIAATSATNQAAAAQVAQAATATATQAASPPAWFKNPWVWVAGAGLGWYVWKGRKK